MKIWLLIFAVVFCVGTGARAIEIRRTNHSATTAHQLQSWLDRIGYDSAIRAVFGSRYGKITIFDDSIPRLLFTNQSDLCALTSRQRLALNFFFRGEGLTPEEQGELFRNERLPEQLMELGLAARSRGRLWLNDLTLSSYPLRNSKLYVFSDIPQYLSAFGREPTAEIHWTSQRMVELLEEKTGYSGIAADLGSGTGILSLALLRLNPRLEKVIGLEVDPRSITLSEFNADLNAEGHRFKVLNNSDTKHDPLPGVLGSRKLSFVVSNPPSNLVPSRLKPYFSKFGYGGPDGMEILRPLLKQAIRKLASDGEILLFGQTGLGADQRPVLEDALGARAKLKMKVEYQFEGAAITLPEYARWLTNFLHENLGPLPRFPTIAEIVKSFPARVVFLRPLVARITFRGRVREGRLGFPVGRFGTNRFQPFERSH